jgi:hypothetical protein
LQFARVLDQHHAVARLGDLGEERVDKCGLSGGGAAGDEDVLSLADACSQQLGLRTGHNAGVDVIAEGEDGDRRPSDGEAGRRGHRRNEALEALPAFRQFGRDPGAAGMDLDADVVGDEANDALGIGRCDTLPGVFEAAGQSVNPEPAVGIQHHFDDAGVFEVAGDRLAERSAQHARAAGESFRPA